MEQDCNSPYSRFAFFSMTNHHTFLSFLPDESTTSSPCDSKHHRDLHDNVTDIVNDDEDHDDDVAQPLSFSSSSTSSSASSSNPDHNHRRTTTKTPSPPSSSATKTTTTAKLATLASRMPEADLLALPLLHNGATGQVRFPSSATLSQQQQQQQQVKTIIIVQQQSPLN